MSVCPIRNAPGTGALPDSCAAAVRSAAASSRTSCGARRHDSRYVVGSTAPSYPRAEQGHRVDLEVKVRRRPLRVARVADEAEHVSGPHDRTVHGERRVRGEVRVVELVPARVAKPEAPAADGVPADGEDEAVRHCEERSADRGVDVVAVMPVAGDVAAEGAVGVGDRRGAVHRKDVAGLSEARRDVRRRGKQRREPGPSRLGRRRGRRGERERRRRARLCVRLGVADLELASGRQPAVRSGQRDVERGDETVVAGRRLRGLLPAPLERDRVAPVAELDPPVGGGHDRVSEDDEA